MWKSQIFWAGPLARQALLTSRQPLGYTTCSSFLEALLILKSESEVKVEGKPNHAVNGGKSGGNESAEEGLFCLKRNPFLTISQRVPQSCSALSDDLNPAMAAVAGQLRYGAVSSGSDECMSGVLN